jgi:NADPH-dependent 2,4-dienoyl-CoA reductase/sulfur reductase-like enzyme
MHGQDHSQLADSRPASGPANSNARVRIMDLAEYGEQHKDVCDVLIVGGGPAGLSVARGLDGSKKDIVILESGGLEESAET